MKTNYFIPGKSKFGKFIQSNYFIKNQKSKGMEYDSSCIEDNDFFEKIIQSNNFLHKEQFFFDSLLEISRMIVK